jgi:putative aldouronate transport system permease protein
MKWSKSDLVFEIVTISIIVIVLILILYPIYFTVIASISDPKAVAMGHVGLYPIGFTLEAYKNVFRYDAVWIGYRNTLFYTLFGVLLSLFLTITSAYALSKPNLFGRTFLTWYFLFTMYFSGGLIPTYLIVKNLQLINKPYTLIVLGSFSVFNMIVTRTYFSNSIPESLYESARIDGANEFASFQKIALPLSTTIVAVMVLYYGVARWNSFFSALIYLSDSKLMPLQIVLRNILILNRDLIKSIEIQSIEGEDLSELVRRSWMAEAMKYALIFIASFPLLVAYPFVQKYFVKGVMIGSVKG